MKPLNSLFGTLLGSLGALAGIGLFTTGCHESAHHEQVSATVAEVEACCGTDKNSQDYNTCVQAYQANGVCSSSGTKPDDPILDVPTYGMPDPIPPTPEQLQECCGQNDDSSEYKACVENYTDVNKPHTCRDLIDKPELPSPAIYGPNPFWCCGPDLDECSNIYFNGGGCTSGIDPDESEACCAKASDQNACVREFIQSKKCPTDIKEPTDDEIDACCMLSDWTNDAECEKKYKETGVCDNTDMVQCCRDYDDWVEGSDEATINASCVNLLRKNKSCNSKAKTCCGLDNGTYNDECISLFDKTGKCPEQLNDCCKTKTGTYDRLCIQKFNDNKGQCNTELSDCCRMEDGSYHPGCNAILEQQKQCIRNKDILDCCTGKDEDYVDRVTVSYTCIKYYKEWSHNNICAQDDYGAVAVTIYGGDFRPLYEVCDNYIGDYQKCVDFANAGVSVPEEEAKQCCGEDDKSEKYTKCMDAYREKGKSESCTIPLEKGEPAPNTNPTACCGKYVESSEHVSEWEQCKDAYLETGKCPKEPGDE